MPNNLPPYSRLHHREVYQPGEDSFLLLDAIALLTADSYRPDFVIECGSGSGIISQQLCKSFPAAQVLSVDISPLAIEATQETVVTLNGRGAQANFCRMSFLSNVRSHTADLIVFNPPYVPSDDVDLEPSLIDLAWAGGVDGVESTHPLVRMAHRVLKSNGMLLLLLEKRNKVDEFIQQYANMFEAKKLLERKAPGEHLYIYKFIAR